MSDIDERQILVSIERWLKTMVAPVAKLESDDVYPAELVADMQELGLFFGRVNVAARGVGIARRALKESVKYAQQRSSMGKPIAEHQAIQLKLCEMAAKTRAAELLVEDAARAYDAGGRIDMEAGMAKYFATETAFEAMRIPGGNGYSKEYPIERLPRRTAADHRRGH